ncbi:MAG TPA: M28 family peptidase [Solirubrobacteraceae bacterium]
MLSVNGARDQLDGLLREVVERLAPLDRTPCSDGEREAAEWLAGRLRQLGVADVALEDEPSWGTFPPTSAGLGGLGILGTALVRDGRRRGLGALLSAVSLAGVLDEAQNGPRIVRRLVRRKRTTVNVVAKLGDWSTSRVPGGGVVDTLVLLAHHDAPQTGFMFDQSLQRRLVELAPQRMARAKTSFPQWWLGLAGPLGSMFAAATRRRTGTGFPLLLGLLGVAMVCDVWRSETVQGANDNLSGVAVLVAIASLLSARPTSKLRVMLASCGAEETLQDGIRAFVARHRSELDPTRTCFVNLDTVGSPALVMLEGEGPIWMEDYRGPWVRDLISTCATELGIELERGFRARSSTDSVIPNRAGYPIATLLSINEWRSPSNYHLPSDVPDNLDYGTVAEASLLVERVARALDEGRA